MKMTTSEIPAGIAPDHPGVCGTLFDSALSEELPDKPPLLQVEPPTGPAIRIGVSACLLGEKVRYDGGHKHDRYITDVLGRYFRFVPVCPEAEAGLGIPREAMRLEGDPAAPRLVTNRSHRDLTDLMQGYCRRKVDELAGAGLCGFIFKKGSPSSGLYRVKVYRNGLPAAGGRGLFAAALTGRFPLLPAEEEGRLADPGLRENFIERVFACHRWQQFLAEQPAHGKLVAFHTRHKLQLMAHSPDAYRQLGALVAHGHEQELPALLADYEQLFMQGLARPATFSRHCNVLHHILGYFKLDLSAAEKAEVLDLIERYRQRQLPLIVPITLLKHFVNKYGKAYLQQQYYLSPHPDELMLRNHV